MTDLKTQMAITWDPSSLPQHSMVLREVGIDTTTNGTTPKADNDTSTTTYTTTGINTDTTKTTTTTLNI